MANWISKEHGIKTIIWSLPILQKLSLSFIRLGRNRPGWLGLLLMWTLNSRQWCFSFLYCIQTATREVTKDEKWRTTLVCCWFEHSFSASLLAQNTRQRQSQPPLFLTSIPLSQRIWTVLILGVWKSRSPWRNSPKLPTEWEACRCQGLM